MMSLRVRTFTGIALDISFMLLGLLKSGPSWHYNATIFRKTPSTFEKGMLRVTGTTHDAVKTAMMQEINEIHSREYLVNKQKLFANFPYARYATYCTCRFQIANCTSGLYFFESKEYFIEKYKSYSFESEAAVLPNEIFVYSSPHVCVRVADITLFRKNLEWHLVFIAKIEGESIEEHLDDVKVDNSHQRAILMDEGYQGITREVSGIISKKKTSGSISTADRLRNEIIASDRVIVENYLGRETKLCTVLDGRFRFLENLNDPNMSICGRLTNLHIIRHALRSEDNDSYQIWQREVFPVDPMQALKRSLDQQRYRERHQRCFGDTEKSLAQKSSD